MQNTKRKIGYFFLFFLILVVAAVWGAGFYQGIAAWKGELIEEGIKIGDCAVCVDFYENVDPVYDPSLRTITTVKGIITEINDKEFSLKVKEVGRETYIRKWYIWMPDLFHLPKRPPISEGDIFVCKPEIHEEKEDTERIRQKISIKKDSCI